MATHLPRVFLAVRAGHPELVPLLSRLGLPVVCLTREASEFLDAATPTVPYVVVSRPNRSDVEIGKDDVLVVNLLPNRVDVLLHSLIRSCCERGTFVLVRPEDFDSFTMMENEKPRLISTAFRYCGGFDNTLARVFQSAAAPEKSTTQLTVFKFDSDLPEWLAAMKNVVGTSSTDLSIGEIINVGASSESQLGPSTQAVSIAQRVGPSEDIADESWDAVFVFLSDGEVVVPSDPVKPNLCLVSPCDSFDAGQWDAAREGAFTAANRIVDSCAFNSAPFVGAMALTVSRRGRVIGLVTSHTELTQLFSKIKNFEKGLVGCATNSLGFVSDLEVSETVMVPRKVRMAALGSTPGGTSLQPIIDELTLGGSALADKVELVLVLSDKEDAGVLRRTKAAFSSKVATVRLSAKGKTRAEFDRQVTDELERRGVDLIVLVGYMRIVSDEFCVRWRGRILNVHPSLLPEFAGGMDLQVHQAVLEAGKTISGCSVHLVTEVVDGGPVVLQKKCEVDSSKDTPEDLKKRVQALEGPCLIESILAFATRTGFFAAPLSSQEERLTYEQAGVSTARGDELVERIKNFCRATRRPGCDPELGGFGACFNLHALGFKDPIMVSGTDGVGTKLILAQQLGMDGTVGIDLVAMSVNDLIVQGAEPMFFLDYFACGKLSLDQGSNVVSGIARGCEMSGCALIGGETAEMPGMYPDGVYDLAGFAFGVVERQAMLPRQVSEGDVLIGLKSSGVHSNGYSLVRKIIKGMDLSQRPPFPSTKPTLKQVLMEPTKVYWKSVRKALKAGVVEAMAHITGSGLPGNLPRVYDESKLSAEVDLASWDAPAIFHFLARKGPVALGEMLDTFNCGVGMVLIVRADNVQRVLELIPDEDEAFIMGVMRVKKDPTEPSVTFVGRSSLDISDASSPSSISTATTVTYASAGVDIHVGDAFVERIKPFCRATRRPGCKTLDLGGFGSLFDLKEMSRSFEAPIIVSGTDGVGTKLMLAQHHGKHDTVGIDLVAMSVNDLIVQGAEPLFFLDYLACGKLDIDVLTSVVSGIAEGCSQSECALVGGETAEMPGMYPVDEYDLAGFAVGVVDRKDLLPLPTHDADVIVGLKSSGVHSNGYSLVRKVVDKAKLSLSDTCPFDSSKSLGDALLTPTKIYWRSVKPLLEAKLVSAMAHITGSGIDGNLPRVFDERTLYAEVDLASWRPGDVFSFLRNHGNIETREMLATFNCGLGMMLIVRKENVQRVLSLLGDETVGVVGVLKSKSSPSQPSVVYVNEEKFFA